MRNTREVDKATTMIAAHSRMDPGEFLADLTALRKAYTAAVKVVHPNALGGSNEKFDAVREAYRVLLLATFGVEE